MAHTITFDTLQYAKKAREIGFTEEQAEFLAEEMARIANGQYETAPIKNDSSATKRDLEYWIKELVYRLTIRAGVFSVAIISILAVIIKF